MSDHDQWPENPNEVPSQPKSGGGCLKVILIIGGIGLFGLVVCCGGLFWIGSGFIPKEVNTPAEVAVVGQEAMKIDIPAEFVGQEGASIDNFMMTMKFATYQHQEQKGTLEIASLRVKMGDLKDQLALFNAQKAQQDSAPEGLKITTTEDREFTIQGQAVKFKFSEAEQAGTGKKFQVVSSEFESGGRLMLLQLTLEEEAYDEEAVVKMIESIQ